MKILVLVTRAFGGSGGIAKFYRDLLMSLCAYSDCTEVVTVPRLIPSTVRFLPTKLSYVAAGLNGKLKYIAAVLKVVCNNPKFDLIVCGHINLLPLAGLHRLGLKP